MKQAFTVINPDMSLSPFIGMTRRHYIELAKYLLDRAFVHVMDENKTINFPVVPGKTYPQPGAPDWR
jgi:hypothetical protein